MYEGRNEGAGSASGSRKLGGGAIASLGGLGLLIVFMFQNTESVQLDFLFWSFTWPLWLLVLASANRDRARFENPDGFDVARDPRGHVAFGFGIHFCLGASLARLEARVGFEELLSRVGRLEALDSQVDYIDSFLLRGPASLRLRAEQN